MRLKAVRPKLIPSYSSSIRRPQAYLLDQKVFHPSAGEIANEVELDQPWATAVDIVKGEIEWRKSVGD